MRQFVLVSGRPLIYFASLLLASLILLPSCNDSNGCIDGSGGLITSELDIEGFHSVITDGSWDVAFEQGSKQIVTVEGMQNIIADITTEVSDSIWEIGLKGTCYNNLDLLIHIVMPDVKSIESAGADRVVLNSFDSLDRLKIILSGSGNVFQSGLLTVADKLTLKNSGSGDMTAHSYAQFVDAQVTGSGDITVSGTTYSQTANLNGSGNYYAIGLESEECTIENSESGDAEVWVNDSLDVTISGSGNVSYKQLGDTVFVNKSITGSGKLIELD